MRLARDNNYYFAIHRPETHDYWLPRGLTRGPSLSAALGQRLDVKVVVAVLSIPQEKACT